MNIILLKTLFFTGLFIVGFTYIGYGIVVWLLLKIKGKKLSPQKDLADQDLPSVSLLIAAYNEKDILAEKIKNCQALNYPANKLDIVFVTDGSTDGSEQMLQQYPDIQNLHQHARQGKIAAIKRAMRTIQSDIVVFTDANTLLNSGAIRRLVRDFQDPSVGAVSGEKRVVSQGDASSGGEGLYWKYESFLKRQDSQLYSVVGAAGELYAIRRNCYHDVAADTILDDFMHTLLIAKDGYRVTYAPDAYAEEYASANISEELKRKVRISAGGFQSMARLLPLLNIFQYGLLSFQYIGHRVLRWTLAPLFLPIILLCNIYLVALGQAVFYEALLAAQIIFYAFAFLGYLLQHKKVNIKGFFAPYYFVMMNYSVFAGFIRYTKGQQQAAWEKAKRQVGVEV